MMMIIIENPLTYLFPPDCPHFAHKSLKCQHNQS